MMNILRLAINKVLKPFSDLAEAPRAIWYVIGAFALDSIAYFGLLTLMTTYLSQDLGWGDKYAGITVSIFTMSVTLAMLGIGSVAESFGLRRAILAALVVAVLGRMIYCLAPSAPGAWSTIAMVAFGLLLAAFSGGILQPVCYSGVRQFTDDKTSSMGYAMIYAFMNLGIVVAGEVSAYFRPAVQEIIDTRGGSSSSGGFCPGWLGLPEVECKQSTGSVLA
jgi:proton-dependent oligopeptide transporter, POT family